MWAFSRSHGGKIHIFVSWLGQDSSRPNPTTQIPVEPWHMGAQTPTPATHKSSRRESRQEVKNTATSYDISPHHTHSVNTTYRRFFEAESARFLICKHNTSCCSNTSPPTTFWHYGWRQFSLGNSKHVENERRSSGKTSIHSENLGNQSVRPVRFWY